MINLANRASGMYRVAKDGLDEKGKIIYDPASPLKETQQRINDVIMTAVDFPSYINGGIRGRNYRDDCLLHVGARTVINLDISTFFESVSERAIRNLWLRLFGFAKPVAQILTRLTSYKGRLPRGAPTSSYLANLLFYDSEPGLVDKLSTMEITYSRYIDDVSLSATHSLSKDDVTQAIGFVYGMFLQKGVKANRVKQRVGYSSRPLRVHAINVNASEPTIPKDVRRGIKAGVHNLWRDYEVQGLTGELLGRMRVVQGQVAWMMQFHPIQGAQLKVSIGKLVQELNSVVPASEDLSADRSQITSGTIAVVK